MDINTVVLAGTNGEAAALTTTEKTKLVRLAAEIKRRHGKENIPLVLGCGGGCTSAVLDETIEAARAGAAYALVLVPSFFYSAMDSDAIIGFFREVCLKRKHGELFAQQLIAFFVQVADNSPIPILIYNFPAVAGGLDVNSEMLHVLGQHPNIVGVKLTCGGIGKVARSSALFSAEEFAVFAGQSDWLLPALTVGAAGCITGVANLYPKVSKAGNLSGGDSQVLRVTDRNDCDQTCVELYNLYSSGALEDAKRVQEWIGTMEWGFAKGGINGTKWVVARSLGYPESSAHCRRPFPRFDDESKRRWIVKQVSGLDAVETRLKDGEPATSAAVM